MNPKLVPGFEPQYLMKAGTSGSHLQSFGRYKHEDQKYKVFHSYTGSSKLKASLGYQHEILSQKSKKKNKTKKLVPDFGLGVCSLVGELLVFDRDLGCFEK